MAQRKKNVKKNNDNVDGLIDLTLRTELFTPTPHLRYSKKLIEIDGLSAKYEYKIQQLWTGDCGGRQWRWIESVD